MKLYEGKEEEYKKRHDELWPEMKEMIQEYTASGTMWFLGRNA